MNENLNNQPDTDDDDNFDGTFTWNHRVLRDSYGTMYLAEVHYENGQPVGYTSASVIGDTLDEMRRVLRYMTAALDKPVLDDSMFEQPKFDEDSNEIPTA